MWLVRRGKLIGLLFWPGALFYVFYTYLVYVFSMPLNVAFLLHLTLVTLSAYTMIGLVASIDGKAVQHKLTCAVPERAGGSVLAGLGILFFVRVTSVMINALISQTPVTAVELALHVSDFMITPAWVIGGVLLWRREAIGYVTGLGLLFQASMLFIGLIFILILQPFITAAQFVLSDVLVIFVMSMVCFIPFALFVRGAASKRNPSSTTEKPHSLRRSCAVANLGQGELTLPAATTPAATSSIVSLRTSLCYLDGSFIYFLAIELVDGL
jgi:hypothetical protein